MTDLVEQVRELRWKLLATRRVRFTAPDGPTELPVNPDGPEAAAALEAQSAEIERLKKLVEEAREAAREIDREYREHDAAAIDVMAEIARTLLTKLTEVGDED